MTTIIYSGNIHRGGKSSVNIVKTYSKYIKIYFRNPLNNQATYKYYKSTIGTRSFNKIIQLANQGEGLNHYLVKYGIRCKRQ